MSRLQLNEALEMAGKLYDEFSLNRAGNGRENDCYAALKSLTLRKIVIESLSRELAMRKLLPVTLNTLSTLFASVYTQFAV